MSGSCDTRTKKLAEALYKAFGGDRHRWHEEMRRVFNNPKRGPDLDELWSSTQARMAEAERRRPAGQGYVQGPVEQPAVAEAPAPVLPGSALAGDSWAHVDELINASKEMKAAGQQGPLSVKVGAETKVSDVVEVSRKPLEKRVGLIDQAIEGLKATFSHAHDLGPFKQAWRVTEARLDRKLEVARRLRPVFQDRLLGYIKDESAGGPTAIDKVRDGEQIVVLRDMKARYVEDSERAKKALPDLVKQVREVEKAMVDLKAKGAEISRADLEGYARKKKALEELVRVARDGPELPGGVTYDDVERTLSTLLKTAHKDSVTYAETLRAMLDATRDNLVSRGLLSETGARKDYFPHKLIESFMRGVVGRGSGTPGRAKSEQYRGYTKVARSNRRLYDTNVTEVALDYMTEVARHNALDDWYQEDIRRFAVPMRGKKAMPLEGEFSEADRVAIREGRWEVDGKDRTTEWYARLPLAIRELAGATQGVLRMPKSKTMRRLLEEYVDAGGYVDVNARWGTIGAGMADQSPEVRRLIENLREEGWPLPDLPRLKPSFSRGSGKIRVPAMIAKRIEKLRTNPDIYPAETWLNKMTAWFKKNATVTYGGLAYYLRNYGGDLAFAWRDDADPAIRKKYGSVLSWWPTARKVATYKSMLLDMHAPMEPAKLAALKSKAAALEAELRAIHPDIPRWATEAYEMGVTSSGFTAEEAQTGSQRRTAALPGFERFSGMAGEGRLRQFWDKFPVFKQYRRFVDWAAKKNEMREDVLRLAKFMRDRHAQMTPDQAVTLNHQTFINYGQLTEFERRWLSRGLVPFWTFFKANTLGWTRAMGDHPGRVAAYVGASMGLTALWNGLFFNEEEERLWTSPFTRHIAQKPHVFLGFNDAAGNPMVLMFDDPLVDALGIVGQDQAQGLARRIMAGESPFSVLSDAVVKAPLSGAKQIASRLSPYLKTLQEAATGRDSFTDRRFLQGTETGLEVAGKMAGRALTGFHRGAGEASRFKDRVERHGWGAALARSPISPVSPFFRSPDISQNPTIKEKVAKDELQRGLLDRDLAVPGDREGEIVIRRGASQAARESTDQIKALDAKARIRAIEQHVKAGDLERAAGVVGDKARFRGVLSLLTVAEREAFRRLLAAHGTTIDGLARLAKKE